MTDYNDWRQFTDDQWLITMKDDIDSWKLRMILIDDNDWWKGLMTNYWWAMTDDQWHWWLMTSYYEGWPCSMTISDNN